MAATINLPVKVLDEKCADCKAINLEKTDYYSDLDKIFICYQCTNLHLCQYIKNRIVRNEQAERMENALNGVGNEK